MPAVPRARAAAPGRRARVSSLSLSLPLSRSLSEGVKLGPDSAPLAGEAEFYRGLRRLHFVHVPKTGGTSFGRVLRQVGCALNGGSPHLDCCLAGGDDAHCRDECGQAMQVGGGARASRASRNARSPTALRTRSPAVGRAQS